MDFRTSIARHRRITRPRAPALCALAGWLLLCGSLQAAQVDNQAQVSYRLSGTTSSFDTNLVSFAVLSGPTQAKLGFLRYDPDAEDGSNTPIDGGQCRVAGGSFAPIPELWAGDGTAVDPGGAPTDIAEGYYIGEPVLVSVGDTNRNMDPAVREYVDVDISTTTGDQETLRLQETGVDTGMFAGAIQSVPMPPEAIEYDCTLSLAASAELTARYTDTDFPLDALTAAAVSYAPLDIMTVMRLEQTVSKQIVEIGDFLQYTLLLRNDHHAAASNVRITDVLPVGMRYRAGSLRVGNATAPQAPVVAPTSTSAGGVAPVAQAQDVDAGMLAVADPAISGDGRTMTFPVGNLAPGASITATFVGEVGAGAGAELVNFAIARANGSLASNETDTLVRMRRSLLTSHLTIIGRVVEAGCKTPASEAAGVAGVRLLLEDGTFVTTDQNGAYHFEGVRAGTHVVQLDVATLPPGLEASPCNQDTRFAGRGYSQFVEAQGGSLWRADFTLQRKPPETGSIGTRLQLSAADGKLDYSLDIDGSTVPVTAARAMVILPQGATVVPGSAVLDGASIPDPQLMGNFAIFPLGDPGRDWRRQLHFQTTAATCSGDGHAAKASILFEAGGGKGRTPMAEVRLPCPGNGPGSTAASERVQAETAAAAEQAASASSTQGDHRPEILDDATAAGGGDVDWLHGQAAGRDWLFPAEGYNPRAPVTRAVIKHMQGDAIVLRINGIEVEAIRFDGRRDGAGGLAASTWNSIHLQDGDNTLEAVITDANGAVVSQLSRRIHYANDVASAHLVPEQSLLVADGLRKPMIAVRMLDRAGQPVRHGVSGEFTVSSPYRAASSVEAEQRRQIAGQAGDKPKWVVQGDEGIAYIELSPTGDAGLAKLGFEFRIDGQPRPLHQDIEAWLKSAPRDWVVVGFAKGSVGYDTLADNMQALAPGEDGNGVRGKGQASLYAKGRVLGKWMLTLAYDSDKPTDRLRNKGLLSTIDPNQYYTLYGDGSQQGYDAASARKLYLKLEHDQFYALFGDFQTGLDRNELSRYQRTVNGVKVEYRGPLLEFNGFAAETSQSYVRDEIQGDGTSGLYRLRHDGIVLNSERIRIETRDRYHSEQVLDSRDLVRHIDYDIDYDNGTLFFREPIASRDFEFNPNWIVAEYETSGNGDEYLSGGGRVGIRALEGRLEAGATYLHDEDADARSELAGVDARFRLAPNDELRAEFASSRNRAGAGDTSGSAWLLEWEHRGEQLNLLAYARRQGLGFGLGQQSGQQSGMFKTGVQGQFQVGADFSLRGEIYRQENLQTDAVRDAARVELEYRRDQWSARAGLQWARDKGADGQVAESQQVMLGATRKFLDGKVELGAQADFSLGGKNDSVDFPTRVQLDAAYRINDAFRLLAAQEFTDGEDRDTSTTRLGFEAKPWKDATLTSTLNQSQVSEYGPRTFALMGLNQRFVVNERWSFDIAVDSSHAFNESGDTPLVVDPSQPIQAGGIRDGGALTEDFVALSTGATYRTETWMWNLRTEGRSSDENDRYGFSTNFLRQVRDGVAMSASAQAFSQRNADGSTGILANAQLSGAWRPLGSNWSMLDKLEFRLDELRAGSGESIIGNATLAATGDARSARFINNFVLNYASGAWDGEDAAGNPLDLYQRSQLSLYYGSKYVIDSYGGDDYSGYTDILGAEYRFDLTSRVDIGIRASVLHSWSQDTIAWAFGPSVGFTPFINTWVSVGYNVRGFNDRDFEASHYTAEGAYLVFRMKFDQNTFGLDRSSATLP